MSPDKDLLDTPGQSTSDDVKRSTTPTDKSDGAVEEPKGGMGGYVVSMLGRTGETPKITLSAHLQVCRSHQLGAQHHCVYRSNRRWNLTSTNVSHTCTPSRFVIQGDKGLWNLTALSLGHLTNTH